MKTTMEVAATRLQLLSAHLIPAEGEEAVVYRLDASAAVRPVPGGGKGRLHVVDERTGRKYDIEVNDDGAIRASDFKKVPPLLQQLF